MMLFFPWSCQKNIPPNLGGQWSWNCYDKQILCFYQQNPLFISRFSTQMGINSTFWKRSNRWELVGYKKNVKTSGFFSETSFKCYTNCQSEFILPWINPKIWRQIVYKYMLSLGFCFKIRVQFLRKYILILCFII